MHGSNPARRLPVAAFLGILTLSLLLIACGDRDGGEPSPAATTGTATSTMTTVPATSTDQTSPTLAGPASRFTVLLQDLDGEWIAAVEQTYVLALGCPPDDDGTDCDEASGLGIFAPGDDGAALLEDWGYQSGYQSGAEPEGRLPSILNGGYAWTIETHLFATDDGARTAYDYFKGRFDAVTAVKKLPAPALGNQSAAWEANLGPIENGGGTTSTGHYVLIQRGNLLALAHTQAAAGFASIEQVTNLATIVDAKALGGLAPVEPTPINFGTATATTTPSTSPTASRTVAP